MKLTLGAIPYGWGVDHAEAFYTKAAESPAGTVVLGETLCSKRRLPIDRLGRWAEKLARAGKEVRLGSLCLITTPEEMEYTRDLASLPYPMEVNHVAALELCRSMRKAFWIGPHIGIYNHATAARYIALGSVGISLHPELTERAIRAIVRDLERPVEVLGLGRLPLSISWRCFTARAHGLPKRDCRYICREHPEGVVLETLDGVPIWIANGTQMVSARHYNLVEQLDRLADIGVSAVRIDPHPALGPAGLDGFVRVLNGTMTADRMCEELAPFAYPGFCNGWFFGQEGMTYVDAP